MGSDVSFRVEFDQSVDPSEAAANAKLRVFKADGDRGDLVRLVASREPTPSPKVPASYVVVLKPEKALPLDHQVELTLGKVHGTGGPRPMSEPVTRMMRTHGPLRFVDFYCPRIEPKGRCRANGDVKVVMSNPVSPEELKSHVKLAKLPPRPPPKPGQKAPPRRIDPATEHWLGVAPKLGEQLHRHGRRGHARHLRAEAREGRELRARRRGAAREAGRRRRRSRSAPASSAQPTGRPPRRAQRPSRTTRGLAASAFRTSSISASSARSSRRAAVTRSPSAPSTSRRTRRSRPASPTRRPRRGRSRAARPPTSSRATASPRPGGRRRPR